MDYKFSYTKELDGRFIEAKILVYDGKTTTENEKDLVTRELKPITRYRRTKILQQKTYYPEQLKNIGSMPELVSFVNKDVGIIQ